MLIYFFVLCPITDFSFYLHLATCDFLDLPVEDTDMNHLFGQIKDYWETLNPLISFLIQEF